MRVNEDLEYFSVPEIGHMLGIRQQSVRSMLSDKKLLAVRRGPNHALSISADQIVEKDGVHVALPSFNGTLTMLADRGYSDEEAHTWLYSQEPELGTTPMQALREGRHRAVRRVVVGLGF